MVAFEKVGAAADTRATGDGRGRRRPRPDQGGDDRRPDRARRMGSPPAAPAPFTATRAATTPTTCAASRQPTARRTPYDSTMADRERKSQAETDKLEAAYRDAMGAMKKAHGEPDPNTGGGGGGGGGGGAGGGGGGSVPAAAAAGGGSTFVPSHDAIFVPAHGGHDDPTGSRRLRRNRRPGHDDPRRSRPRPWAAPRAATPSRRPRAPRRRVRSAASRRHGRAGSAHPRPAGGRRHRRRHGRRHGRHLRCRPRRWHDRRPHGRGDRRSGRPHDRFECACRRHERCAGAFRGGRHGRWRRVADDQGQRRSRCRSRCAGARPAARAAQPPVRPDRPAAAAAGPVRAVRVPERPAAPVARAARRTRRIEEGRVLRGSPGLDRRRGHGPRSDRLTSSRRAVLPPGSAARPGR